MESVSPNLLPVFQWKGRILPSLDVAAVWDICRRAGIRPEGHIPQRVLAGELEQRLKDNRALLKATTPHLDWLVSTYNHIPNAVYLLDRDGILLYSNGNTPDLLTDLKLLPGYDWHQERAGNNGAGTALAQNTPVAIVGDEHFVHQHKSFTCLGVPIHDPNGRLVGAIDFSTDNAHGNSERLAVLIHIAHVIEMELSHQLQERRLERLQVLSHLSAFMAHELANPITSAHGLLHLLQKRNPSHECCDLIARCQASVLEAADVVRDIRSLGPNRSRERFESVSLEQLLQEAAKPHSPGDWRINLALPTNATVYCHRRLMLLALSNLVRNAVEAMPNGGEIHIQAHEADHQVKIVISDNGPGLPEEVQEALFLKSVTTKPEGSGIGLLLIQAIVEYVHAGKISFEPNNPVGAKFMIEIPREHVTVQL